jgi:hypothetical protein
MSCCPVVRLTTPVMYSLIPVYKFWDRKGITLVKTKYIITFPGQSLSKTLEEAMDLSQDRLILELEFFKVLYYISEMKEPSVRKNGSSITRNR